MRDLRFINHKKSLIILAACWVVVQLFLFYRNGIKTDLESVKYIREANNLLFAGSMSSLNFWFYSIQIFLIAFFINIKIGYAGVVIVQLFFSAFATYRLFLFLSRHVSKAAALLSSFLLIINYPFNQYNTFLQTESLYHSFSILYICYLLGIEKFGFRQVIFIVCFLLLITFTRPSGILFYPATIIYILIFRYKNLTPLLKGGVITVLLLAALLILNTAMNTGGGLNFMLPFQKEMVICGVPQKDANIQQSSNPNTVAGLLFYIANNFSQFSRLALQKTISFFGVYRPFYSNLNNIYNCSMFLLLYGFALWGILKWLRTNKGFAFFISAFIFTTWLGLVVTCDDWHNRWLLTLVPSLIILSSKAIDVLLYTSHRKN